MVGAETDGNAMGTAEGTFSPVAGGTGIALGGKRGTGTCSEKVLC